MGKRILVQRRGRGSPRFKSNRHRKRGPARYLPPSVEEREGKMEGHDTHEGHMEEKPEKDVK